MEFLRWRSLRAHFTRLSVASHGTMGGVMGAKPLWCHSARRGGYAALRLSMTPPNDS